MGPRVLREGDDALAGQVRQRRVVAVVDRLAGDDPAHGVARQVQAADRFLAQQVGLQDHIEKAFLQLFAQVQCSIGDQFDLHLRVALHQLRDQRAHPGVDHRVHHADANPPDLGPVAVQRLLEGLGGIEHLFGVFQHLAAFRGQAHAP
ncbi:hypothetical protein D3C80_1674600 [compost metagenome]